jgi:aminoglycoside phosphotransferase (APT) family kinase protein
MIAQYAQAHEQHRFDVGALERYLRERVPGFAGPLKVRQFRGGQFEPDLPSHRRRG